MPASSSDDIAALTDRIARLEAELAATRAAPGPSRRGLLLGAAAATAAVVTASTRPAAAADGDKLTLGSAANEAEHGTKLTLNSASIQEYVLAVSDNGLGPIRQTAGTGTLVGHAQGASTFVGVLGIAENGASSGVLGWAPDVTSNGVGVEGVGATGVRGYVRPQSTGPANSPWSFVGVRGTADVTGTPPPGSVVAGVLASSTAGYGLLANGRLSALYLFAASQPAPPNRAQYSFAGMVDVDTTGALWHCVADGSPGTWRQLSGPTTAGSFHPITPTRVYDSRTPAPAPGRLAAGATRTLSVANGRDIGTGAITVADLVPDGSTAITCNVTVAGTTGAGFATVNPGGTTAVTAATVNWSGDGQILNNGVAVKIAADRTVTVVVGGSAGAATDLVIDVTGYFR